MVINCYSVKDEIDQFAPPMLFSNDAQAMRALLNAYQHDNSVYQTAPQDYTLYFVGQFDTELGYLIPEDPKRICSCSDFRKGESYGS